MQKTRNVIDTIIPSNSAIGAAYQTPISPHTAGKINKLPTRKIKVLEKDIIAETIPLLSAVNNAEEKMLNPENKNCSAYIWKPVIARLYTGLPISVNIEILNAMVDFEIA